MAYEADGNKSATPDGAHPRGTGGATRPRRGRCEHQRTALGARTGRIRRRAPGQHALAAAPRRGPRKPASRLRRRLVIGAGATFGGVAATGGFAGFHGYGHQHEHHHDPDD